MPLGTTHYPVRVQCPGQPSFAVPLGLHVGGLRPLFIQNGLLRPEFAHPAASANNCPNADNNPIQVVAPTDHNCWLWKQQVRTRSATEHNGPVLHCGRAMLCGH